ncbi:hypothetical protein BVRB_027190, partial [Beta vulgaris subsp. vulgaris]
NWRKNQYIMDALLSQIPMPKLSSESLIRRIHRNVSMSANSPVNGQCEGAVPVPSSWVFTPDAVNSLKQGDSSTPTPDLSPRAAASPPTRESPTFKAPQSVQNPFDELEQLEVAQNASRHARFASDLTELSPHLDHPRSVAAPRSQPEMQAAGRFIVKDVSSDSINRAK